MALQIKPEGFIEEADRWEYLWFVHRQGHAVEARVEKVTFPENLKTAVWEPDLDGVKVAALDRESRVAACSRRGALADAKERLFAILQPGQVIDVMVKAVMPPEDGKPPRLVVDVGGGVLVEVPRGSATKRRAERLERLFRPGQQTRAKVTELDRQGDVIRISLAAAEVDPWQAMYRRGDVVAGQVVNQMDGLLFVEVKPGLVGIESAPLQGRLDRGERVACVVMAYYPKQRKLHLQLRARLA